MKITNTTRALVTGANGGLGQAIARALSRQGARVVISGRRAAALEALRSEINAEMIVADLAQREDVNRLAQATQDCDVVVLNAALPASGLLDDFKPEEIDRGFDVNLRAPIHMAQVASRAMMKRKQGHIVFISSISGKVASKGTSLYSATKFGMRGFALGLREDVRSHGVGVSTIFPGFIRDAGMFANTGVKLPAGAGTRSPEDVAKAVVRAIAKNPAEVDVAAFEQRFGGWLAHFAPDFVASIQRASGGDRVSAQMSASNADKREPSADPTAGGTR